MNTPEIIMPLALKGEGFQRRRYKNSRLILTEFSGPNRTKFGKDTVQ